LAAADFFTEAAFLLAGFAFSDNFLATGWCWFLGGYFCLMTQCTWLPEWNIRPLKLWK
jgi:hypothetical protein